VEDLDVNDDYDDDDDSDYDYDDDNAYHISIRRIIVMSSSLSFSIQDTLCGYIVPDNEDTIPSVYETIDTICEWWEVNKYPSFVDEFDAEHKILLTATTTGTSMNNKDTSTINTTTVNIIKSSNQQSPVVVFSWNNKNWMRYYVCFYSLFSRQQKTNLRNFQSIICTSYMLIFFGIVVSNLVGGLALPNIHSGGQLAAQITSGSLVYALLGEIYTPPTITTITTATYSYMYYVLLSIASPPPYHNKHHNLPSFSLSSSSLLSSRSSL
jgi:hypothetical protein